MDLTLLLTTILAFLTSSLVIFTLIWIVFVKRKVFDPRLYVLYGMFHWLLIGQLGTLMGYQFYELLTEIPEKLHLTTAILILTAIISFFVGYFLVPMKRNSCNNIVYSVNSKKLSILTSFMGCLGLISSLYFQKHLSLIQQMHFLPLLLNYFASSASVVAVYVLMNHSKELKGIMGFVLKSILLALVVSSILLSNVTLIFPLFAIVFWFINRQLVFKRSTIIKAIFFVGIVAIWSLFSKSGLQSFITRGEWVSSDYFENPLIELLHRLKTLDLFNPESYGIVVHSMILYSDNLLLGRSFQVIIPFLKLVDPSIRGFGRIIVLDVYGPSYETVNVGWAVPPVGELVANFSYPSVPLFYFILGLVCRYLYSRYKNSRSPIYSLFYSIALPWLFVQQRGDFLNGFVFPAYIIIVATGIIWLCTKKKKCPITIEERE